MPEPKTDPIGSMNRREAERLASGRDRIPGGGALPGEAVAFDVVGPQEVWAAAEQARIAEAHDRAAIEAEAKRQAINDRMHAEALDKLHELGWRYCIVGFDKEPGKPHEPIRAWLPPAEVFARHQPPLTRRQRFGTWMAGLFR